MKNMHQLINRSYFELRDLELVKSHNQFSTTILLKSPRYMSYICASGYRNNPSFASVLSLYIMISDLSGKYMDAGDVDISDRLSALASSIWVCIKDAVLTSKPHRRVKRGLSPDLTCVHGLTKEALGSSLEARASGIALSPAIDMDGHRREFG